MSLAITFNETCQFLRKFIYIMVILTTITYPKYKTLSLLFPKNFKQLTALLYNSIITEP